MNNRLFSPCLRLMGLGLALVLLPQLAVGQSPYEGRSLSRPTISPYLQLLRTPDRILPNYQLYVQPRVNLRNQLSQNRAGLQRLDRRLTAQGARFGATSAKPTGGGGGYLNYSHFYPGAR